MNAITYINQQLNNISHDIWNGCIGDAVNAVDKYTDGQDFWKDYRIHTIKYSFTYFQLLEAYNRINNTCIQPLTITIN